MVMWPNNTDVPCPGAPASGPLPFPTELVEVRIHGRPAIEFIGRIRILPQDSDDVRKMAQGLLENSVTVALGVFIGSIKTASPEAAVEALDLFYRILERRRRHAEARAARELDAELLAGAPPAGAPPPPDAPDDKKSSPDQDGE